MKYFVRFGAPLLASLSLAYAMDGFHSFWTLGTFLIALALLIPAFWGLWQSRERVLSSFRRLSYAERILCPILTVLILSLLPLDVMVPSAKEYAPVKLTAVGTYMGEVEEEDAYDDPFGDPYGDEDGDEDWDEDFDDPFGADLFGADPLGADPFGTMSDADNAIWITGIYVDSQLLDLSACDLPEGWSYQASSQLLQVSVPSGKESEPLTLGTFPWAASVRIRMEAAEDGGSVRLSQGTSSVMIDSRSFEEETVSGTLSLSFEPVVFENLSVLQVICLVLNLLTIGFLLLVLTLVLLSGTLSFLLPVLSAVALFVIGTDIVAAPSVRFVLSLLTGVACCCYKKAQDEQTVNCRQSVWLLALSLYASFAAFGYRLFLAGSVMTFDLHRLCVLLLGTCWFYPILLSALLGMDALGKRCLSLKSSSPLKVWQICFLSGGIFLICISIAFIGFYPGGFPSDLADQLYQGVIGQYDAWHPVTHTLILHLLQLINPSVGFVTFVQLVLFAVLVGKAASIPARLGVRPVWIFLFSALFALLPNQAVTNISPLKDFMFTYALLWGTLLLLELALDLQRGRTAGWLIQMSLCLPLMMLLRHNGILAMLFTICLLIILTVRYWKKIRGFLLIPAVLALVIIVLVTGPLFSYLEVNTHTMSPYITMFCAVGSCLNKGKTFSDETTQKLADVMDLEVWSEYYSRFRGHDYYLYVAGESMDLSQFSFSEAFGIYWEALTRYPDIVIKDRLDGMNLLWDISQPDDPDSFNMKTFPMIYVSESAGLAVPGYEDDEVYLHAGPIARAYNNLVDLTLPGENEHVV